MDKLVIFLILVTLLSMADCRHQYRRHKKSLNELKLSNKHSQFLESYLNAALKNLQQDSQIPTENNKNVVIAQRENRENLANQLLRQSILKNDKKKRSKLNRKRENQAFRVKNNYDNTGEAVVSKLVHRHLNQRATAPTVQVVPSLFRPSVPPQRRTVTRPPLVLPTILSKSTPRIKLPNWKGLKRLIKEEFMKHYKNIPPPKTIVFHEYDKLNGQAGVTVKSDPKTELDKPAYSISDFKNWLIFGIGVGCTFMLFILCILGFHCFRFVRHGDGLFVKTEYTTGNVHAYRCKNNNNPGGSFMNQQKEDDWSSEEEVFNVSIPRSFHGSLKESPRINNSSSIRHSTPVKKSTPTR